jgi:hypothetical protein
MSAKKLARVFHAADLLDFDLTDSLGFDIF